MMTNEEILNEIRATFQLERIAISKEQEQRIKAYLEGTVDFENLIEEIKRKADRKRNHEKT